MQVIGRDLIVGTRLGLVPEDAPMVPLYQDLLAAEKRLRFPRQMSPKRYDLDLRKPVDLERSQLMHRLLLLDIPWGIPEDVRGAKGTFHELWTVEWRPEFTVAMIDHAIWGNTVAQAATAYANHLSSSAPDLEALTALLDRAVLADLGRSHRRAGQVHPREVRVPPVTSDASWMLFPPWRARCATGNVRQDAAAGRRPDCDRCRHGTHQFDPGWDGDSDLAVGLPLACSSLDDEAAAKMLERLEGVHCESEHCSIARDDGNVVCGSLPARRSRGTCTECWPAGVAGCSSSAAPSAERNSADGLAWPSRGVTILPRAPPGSMDCCAAADLLLLHQDTLWGILDDWVTGISAEDFGAVLPLLRRTFSAFPAPERRQMGQRVRRGKAYAGTGAHRPIGGGP